MAVGMDGTRSTWRDRAVRSVGSTAPEALALTRTWLAQEGLAADLRLQSMTEPLPYPAGFFDAVIAIQVIHHAALATIRGIVGEMARVLKPQGFVWVTVSMPKATPRWQHAIETEPGTYLPLEGREQGLLHHQFTPGELRELFAAFIVLATWQDASHHLCLAGLKP